MGPLIECPIVPSDSSEQSDSSDPSDKVSANAASTKPKTAKFQSGHRVVKKVVNTYFYAYTYIQTYKVIKCREVTQNT